MKNILIICAVLLFCVIPSDGYSQKSRSKKKGFDYSAHAKRNAKAKKASTKKWKAGGGNAVGYKCGRKSKTKTRKRRR